MAKDTRKFMGDDDDRCAQAVPELKDQIVKEACADRVEAGRGLVKKEDVWGRVPWPWLSLPSFSSSADFRWVVVLKSCQTNEGKL